MAPWDHEEVGWDVQDWDDYDWDHDAEPKTPWEVPEPPQPFKTNSWATRAAPRTPPLPPPPPSKLPEFEKKKGKQQNDSDSDDL
eukprot:8173901-Karenia_brevis.AAC.1